MLSVPVVPVPVFEAAVVTPDLVAEAKTLLPPAEPVVVPRVPLLVPLPRGTLSLRSGTLKVEEPSPTHNQYQLQQINGHRLNEKQQSHHKEAIQ